MNLRKREREKKKKKDGMRPFPAPPTFRVPFTFASSPLSLSESLEQAIATLGSYSPKKSYRSDVQTFENIYAFFYLDYLQFFFNLFVCLFVCFCFFCVNNNRSSPWNSCQLLLLFILFFFFFQFYLHSYVLKLRNFRIL